VPEACEGKVLAIRDVIHAVSPEIDPEFMRAEPALTRGPPCKALVEGRWVVLMLLLIVAKNAIVELQACVGAELFAAHHEGMPHEHITGCH